MGMTIPQSKPLLINLLGINKSFDLPTTASAVGVDLNTGKQLYYNTSSLGWAEQETITASFGVFSQLTGSLSGTIAGNPFIKAGSNITANYNSLGQWEITGSGASFSSETPQPLVTTGVVGSAGVSSDAARADHSHAVDTAIQYATDPIWTQVDTGTATFTNGTGSLTLTPAQTGVGMVAPITFCSEHFTAVEFIARIQRTATVTGVGSWHHIGLTNAASTMGYLIQMDSGNLISTFYAATPTSWQLFGSAGAITPWDNGLLWLRIVLTPAWATFYQGSGATVPTSWTFLSNRSTSQGAEQSTGPAGKTTHFKFGIGKNAGGTGNFTATTDSLQWRSLLGAPI